MIIDVRAGTTGGAAAGDKIRNIEEFRGSRSADDIRGADQTIGLAEMLWRNTFAPESFYDTAGSDSYDGRGGFDIASYADATDRVVIDLSNLSATVGAEATPDSYSSIEGLEGTAFEDSLAGDGGRNILRGLASADVLAGRGGDDELEGGLGADILDGGTGTDTASYRRASAGIQLNAADITLATGEAAGDSFSSIENIDGTRFADTIEWDDGANLLRGFEGDDVLSGRGGSDVLEGGDGADTLRGGNGGDTLVGGLGVDRLFGDAGDDVIFFRPEDGAIDGGAGFDTARAETNDGLSIRLDAWNIEQLFAGGGNDVIFTVGAFGIAVDAGLGNDVVMGDTGNDTISGNNGNDRLTGAAGNDTIGGGNGDDVIDGGAGVDRMFGEGGNDVIFFAPEDALIDGGPGYDTARALTDAGLTIRLDVWNVEQLFAGNGSDNIFTFGTAAYSVDGAGGNDSISGNVFGDVLSGGAGDDVLDGSGGNDRLGGGVGSDRLLGGLGADVLFGETGADSYVYRSVAEGRDTVVGFELGIDKIEISATGFLPGGGMGAGALDPNRFVAGPATLATGQFLFDRNNGNLFWDVDGTGAQEAQLLLVLQNVGGLTANDFVVV